MREARARLGEHRGREDDPPVRLSLSQSLELAGLEVPGGAEVREDAARRAARLVPDQAITLDQALRAVTIDAARQIGQGDRIGSLEKGKEADLVILEKNPLEVDPMTIKDIVVVETIKEGKSVHKAR